MSLNMDETKMDTENSDFNDKEKERCLNEGKNLIKVRSPYVVEYYNSWLEPGCLYIQMELGLNSLMDILLIKPTIFTRDPGTPMNIFEYFVSCEIFRELLECVQYLHELEPPFIHRDLKPENILITNTGDQDRFIKLCDFGLATVHDKRIHYRTIHKHSADVGDIRYIAPEVSQGMPIQVH
ncbi:unnamed protein product [Oppiella nova]|uniref:Protein kinase domain-containing protein n=1 Tax=Oppiella nova TaxID=334625 RepID=A0A7R9QWV4_9ACAR|nr:unnamed protein product [Oppiella nova]CAG2177346.1 unnamed protein product [Oppiella nova]